MGQLPPAAAGPEENQTTEVSGWLPHLWAPSGTAPSAFAWPLRGVLTQPFGCTGVPLERPGPGCPSGFHTGIDLADPEGTPVRASAAGLAYPFTEGVRYGNHVVVQHPGGYATVYAHLAAIGVTWGQAVPAGDVIGWVGSTGNSSGPHLHFEVRFAGTPLDPMPFLAGRGQDPFPLPAGWPGAPPDDWRGLR